MGAMTRRRSVVSLVAMTALLATIAAASFEEAVKLFERRDYPGAIATLEKDLRQGQDGARVRTLLGWSYYKAGETSRAKSEFDRALGLNQNDPNAFYAHEGLGWIAYHAGDFERTCTARCTHRRARAEDEPVAQHLAAVRPFAHHHQRGNGTDARGDERERTLGDQQATGAARQSIGLSHVELGPDAEADPAETELEDRSQVAKDVIGEDPHGRQSRHRTECDNDERFDDFNR